MCVFFSHKIANPDQAPLEKVQFDQIDHKSLVRHQLLQTVAVVRLFLHNLPSLMKSE